MKYPVVEFFKGEGVINKDSWIAHKKEVEDIKFDILKRYKIDTAMLIFADPKTWPDFLKEKMEVVYNFTSVSYNEPVYLYNKKFIIANAWVGAPAAATLMEELGFLGIKNFITCGSCGLIDHTIDSSKFFLIERAIRDEGTSYKYLKPSRYAYTNIDLTNKLAVFLDKKQLEYMRTTTWTTDAFYRETPASIEKRLKQGAVCVDMESSAWCSVAELRGYKFAQLLFSSDITKQGVWTVKTKEERNGIRNGIIKLMLDFVTEFVKEK